MLGNKKQIDPNLKPEELERQAYARSIRLLGSREHSSTELRTKLSKVGFSADTIDATLQLLIESGYQSDERFATLYSEQLLRKHYGPQAISAKLAARGIDSSLAREAISSALGETGLNWAEVAAEALLAKFSFTELTAPENSGSASANDSGLADSSKDDSAEHESSWKSRAEEREQQQLDKAKYARFLNRRGFSSTDSIKAIRLAAETVSV